MGLSEGEGDHKCTATSASLYLMLDQDAQAFLQQQRV